MRKAPFRLMAATLLCATASCAGAGNESKTGGLIVINAPVTGQVRRVLVTEGASVKEGTAIIEIAVQKAGAALPQSTADAQSEARAAVETSTKEIAAAEADVEKALVDVQRAEQNVASGLASQGEVDAARARYQQAQQRLDSMREKSQIARDNLAYQRGRRSTDTVATREEIVPVRVTASGTIRAISSRIGQQVTQGQPLATLSTVDR